MEMDNKNDKQVYFNQIKGVIAELNDAEEFCSVTIKCGHEKPRDVNLSTKKEQFDIIKKKFSIGDKVVCKYYPVSKKKHARWYDSLILMSISFD
jgi:hypothetical protein